MRIIFAGFQHETNTFAPDLADDAAFAHGGGFPPLSRGADVLKALVPTANIPGAGFLNAARAAGDEIVPILWTAACPSGFVARDTYERIAGEIVAGIRAALPADAIYLDLHGAMVAEHVFDGEGELLARIRAVTDIPVIVSLDLHANVTQRMIDLADALVAFRTYPHVDMAETGRRAHRLLERRVAGAPFAKAAHRIPYMMPICWQATGEQPAKGLYESLAAIEAETAVPSISYAMGFAAADFPECSPVVWAYGETPEQAQAAADALYAQVLAAETAFSGPLYDPDAVVEKALALNAGGVRPVVIADAQDNPGAGGSSDTMGILRALIAHDVPSAAIGPIFDPAAAQAAHRAGVGAQVTLDLGGRAPIAGDSPLRETFTVEALSDGRLRTHGPYFGELDMDLGPSACLRHGGVRIVVASAKVQMADREMFRYLGIDPEAMDIVVVKSAIHFRADFGPIAGEILTAVAPGAMMMRATDWTWKHLPDELRLMPGGPSFAETKTPEQA
ncbi:M81 family peptidase [Sinirhodobacter populi]|uniref:Microcystinase C n=1 Tax=Paenirhodobacter populi TaxID=2306993 RepID=A0A443KI56_9RHOB|nr:M81 family metallopeptidase [Sinirhodobacter populi]RWR32462.1 M81 family peptidase [Sinirhodobacter populi]